MLRLLCFSDHGNEILGLSDVAGNIEGSYLCGMDDELVEGNDEGSEKQRSTVNEPPLKVRQMTLLVVCYHDYYFTLERERVCVCVCDMHCCIALIITTHFIATAAVNINVLI